MGEDERQGGGGRGGGAGVDVVDAVVPELEAVAGELVEGGFLGGPVEFVGPVGGEFAEVVQVGADRPACVFGGVGPAGRAQPCAQVLQCGRVGLRGERLRAGQDARHVRHDGYF